MESRRGSDNSDVVRKLSWVEPVPYVKKRRLSSIKPLQPRKSKDVSLFATKTGIGEDVTKMEENPKNYEIQMEGCKKMGTYASYGSIDVMVSRPHGIEMIIEAMETFCDKYELQLAAMNSLSQLASGNSAEASCMYIHKNSGLKAILGALNRFPNETQLQYTALKCIYAMSSHEDIINILGTERVAKIAVEEIKRGVTSAAVLQTGFLTLANACVDEKTAWYVVETQVLNGILDDLMKLQQKPELLEAGCRLIGSLAFHESICEVLSGPKCLRIILAALDLAVDNSELAESVAWASACITKCGTSKDAFVIRGGLVKLSLTMGRFPKILPIQEYGCWTISNISESEDPTIKGKVVNISTANLLLDAMNKFADHEEIQEQAIFALAQFLEEQDIQIHLYQKEGIRSVIKAMRYFSENPEIQEQGCRVLGNLAVTELVRTAVAQDGGISAVVSAMERFQDNEQLLEYGCHALANLAAEVAENKASIAEEEGITAILSSMDKHESNCLIQISGCRALCNLAANELISLKILQDGGLPTLLSAMMNFKQDDVVEELSFNTLLLLADAMESRKDVIRQETTLTAILNMMRRKDADISHKSLCCKLLHTFAYEEENHELFIDMDVIVDVVRIMKENQGVREIQEYGCKLLALMSYGNGKESVIRENGIDMIFSAMERYQDNLQLQLVCSGALSYLAKEDVNKTRVDNDSWIKVLLRNMKKFSDNRDMQVVGCLTIPGLVMDGSQSHVTEEDGFIDLVLAAMRRFPTSPDVLMYGCNTLSSLATNDWLRDVMMLKMVEKVVIESMKRFPKTTDIQLIGCQVLERLAKRDSRDWYEASDDVLEVLENILGRFQDYERAYKVANNLLHKIKGVPI